MGLAVPLIRRKVAPNALYGVRVKATFADEEVWYDANERSGRDLFLIGATELLGALLLPSLLGNAGVVVLILFLLVSVVWSGIRGVRYANRLLEAKQRGEASP